MRNSRWIYALFPLLLLSACNGKDPMEIEQKVNSYKVAVVLPSSEKVELSKIVDWAQENIKNAQKGQESRVELEVEWIDEEGTAVTPGLLPRKAFPIASRSWRRQLLPRNSSASMRAAI